VQVTRPSKLPSLAEPWTPNAVLCPAPKLLFQAQQGSMIRFEGSVGIVLLISTFQPFTVTGSPKSSSTCQSLIETGPLLVTVVSTWKYWPLLQVLMALTVQLTLPPPEPDELEELLLEDDELDDELLEELVLLDELELELDELELLLDGVEFMKS
jgi:hypothetical protein